MIKKTDDLLVGLKNNPGPHFYNLQYFLCATIP